MEEREIMEREMIIEKEKGRTEEEGIRGERESGESSFTNNRVFQ